mmetsp:Transcript_40336/g.106990  ORF Transcript_40336/g.106990 Transcript_40336/m.106990 type:complete len:214 (-) Transcript_40336:395-1036(-)
MRILLDAFVSTASSIHAAMQVSRAPVFTSRSCLNVDESVAEPSTAVKRQISTTPELVPTTNTTPASSSVVRVMDLILARFPSAGSEHTTCNEEVPGVNLRMRSSPLPSPRTTNSSVRKRRAVRGTWRKVPTELSENFARSPVLASRTDSSRALSTAMWLPLGDHSSASATVSMERCAAEVPRVRSQRRTLRSRPQLAMMRPEGCTATETTALL